MAMSEVERIRAVYAHRAVSVDQRRYTPFDPAYQLLRYSRERAFLQLLKHYGIYTLKELRILEVGCGAGDILIEYLSYGAKPRDLFGVDVLPDELAKGHERSPNLRLFCADGQCLPFSDSSFDVVAQYTVFTSVLDSNVRQHIAAEMLRVVKTEGLIVSYDFWPNNPKNPDVRGLRLCEIKTLFPRCRYDVQRIVFAPPIARRLAPVSPMVCQILEKIPWLCTHYMIGIIRAESR